MLYTITPNNLCIRHSFTYYKAEMQRCLDEIQALHPNSYVWNRTPRSLRAEWCVHNALYRLHFMRSHTADVDLNHPNRYEWAYLLLAPLARLIIK